MGITLGGGISRGQHAALPHTPAMVAGFLQIVRKTIDETVNNSAVLQNDNELLFNMGANETWFILTNLRCSTKAASGFKLAFTVPAGAAFRGTWTNQAFLGDEYDLTASLNTGAGLALPVFKHFAAYIGGAAAGVLRLQWAQSVAVAEDTTVLANSSMIAIRVS